MSKKNRKIYDLSLPFSRNLPTWGMSLSFYNPPMFATYSEFGKSLLEEKTGRTVEKEFYDTVVTFFSHTGTHFDAPIHCDPKHGWSIDEVPLDRLWGEGVVVSIPKGELGEIGPKDFENATPKIQKGDIVVVNTGWHKNYSGPMDDWDKAVYYSRKNPGIMKEGVDWLIDKGIKVLMVDYMGVDHPKNTPLYESHSWPAHIGLLSANIPMVQNINGQVDQVTGKRCTICIGLVNYVGGDSFPVRVLVTVEE